jgi:hypothetical protein
MKKAPRIGQRVRYCSHELVEYEGAPRIVTGTVMAIYESWDEALRLEPETEWSAAVKVDEIPTWWAYPGTDRFAPQVSELKPL